MAFSSTTLPAADLPDPAPETARGPNGAPPARRRLIATPAAAAVIGVQPNTAERWRCKNQGPPHYVLQGRVYYDADELDQWIAARRVEPGKDAAA